MLSRLSLLKNRRLWLIFLFAWLCLYHTVVARSVIDYLRNGQVKAAPPVNFAPGSELISGMTADAYEAGVRDGDRLISVDGKPFLGMRVLFEAVNRRKPEDLLPMVVRSAKGTEFGVNIRIPAQSTESTTTFEWIAQLAQVIAIPAFCLSLGFCVAFLRPNQRAAWLLLALMIGFSGLAQDFLIAELPNQLLLIGWWALFASPFALWTVWLVFFPVVFPARLHLDQRMPWLKWLAAVPFFLFTAVIATFEVGREISFQSTEVVRPYFQNMLAARLDLLVPLAAVLAFSALASIRAARHSSADGKRRLRLLLLGSAISLAPLVVQTIRSLKTGVDLLAWAGPLQYFATLLPLLLLPLVLAYVIMVRRAQDVQATVRQVLYATFTGRGLFLTQLLLTAAAMSLVAVASASMIVVAAAVVAIVSLRPLAHWLVPWLDRHLFRKAYAAEQSLQKLTTELLTWMEEKTLLQTVTRRTAAALQLQRIAFLLKREGELSPAVSIGYASEPPPAMPENSGVVRYLKLFQKAAPIYFDDAKNWIHSVHPVEQEPIKTHETQIVIPVALKDQILALLVLGPRLRAVPYTQRDLKLLNNLATQTAISLTNARLAASLQISRPPHPSPEPEPDDRQQPHAPNLASEMASFDEPGVRPNDLHQV